MESNLLENSLDTNKLSPLKTAFEPYDSLWDDWCKLKQHGLNGTELYVLYLYCNTQFKTIDRKIPKEIDLDTVTETLQKKLLQKQNAFKDWAIFRFQHEVIRLAKHLYWYKFYQTDLTTLLIDEDLKQALLGFKTKTLDELFSRYSDKDFRRPALFEWVVKFLIANKAFKNNVKAQQLMLALMQAVGSKSNKRIKPTQRTRKTFTIS